MATPARRAVRLVGTSVPASAKTARAALMIAIRLRSPSERRPSAAGSNCDEVTRVPFTSNSAAVRPDSATLGSGGTSPNRRFPVLAARYHRHGSPEVLQLDEVARRAPGPKQVLVRVQATSVNGGELHVRSGALRLVTARRLPVGMRIDVAGVVEAIGGGVRDLSVEHRVWGAPAPLDGAGLPGGSR